MFEDRKMQKKLEQAYQVAMAGDLPALGAHVKADTENLVAGNEVMVCDDPVLVTGPAGVESGEWDLQSWGWLVLTNKRINFKRLDGDRVRVGFFDDFTFDSSSGPFDTYRWQDKAQLRVISFGFLKGATTRSELRSRTKS